MTATPTTIAVLWARLSEGADLVQVRYYPSGGYCYLLDPVTLLSKGEPIPMARIVEWVPLVLDGLIVAERIPVQTVLRGQSGAIYVRCEDFRPDSYPANMPPFTFQWTGIDGHGGMRRTLQVEDDGPLEVIRWAG